MTHVTQRMLLVLHEAWYTLRALLAAARGYRCEGKPYSFESDVWALGCLLYELLTLRPAFRAETIPLLTEKILAGAYAELSPGDEVPPEALQIIDSTLTVAPEGRPSIAQLLALPILSSYALRHEAVDREAAGAGQVRRGHPAATYTCSSTCTRS